MGAIPSGRLDEAIGTIEPDVLSGLSALLRSIADDERRQPVADFESRSEKLRQVNRQIVELTRFLSAVRDCRRQPAEAINAA